MHSSIVCRPHDNDRPLKHSPHVNKVMLIELGISRLPRHTGAMVTMTITSATARQFHPAAFCQLLALASSQVEVQPNFYHSASAEAVAFAFLPLALLTLRVVLAANARAAAFCL